MNKLILILTLAIPLAVSGQKLQVHGGIKGGLHIPVLTGEVSFSGQFRFPVAHFIPYYGGGFVELSFGKHVALQVEGLYTQSGYHWHLNGGSNNTEEIAEKFSYITIPIMAKFKLGGLALYGGYQLNKLNYAERKRSSYSYGDEFENWYSAHAMYVDSFNSIVGGVEYTLRFGLGFSIRYTHGLDDIIDHKQVAGSNTIYQSSDEIYSSAILTGIHWSFGPRRHKK